MKTEQKVKFNHREWPNDVAKIHGVSVEVARDVHMWAMSQYENSYFNGDGKLERYLESLEKSKFKFTVAVVCSTISKFIELLYEDSWIQNVYYWVYRFCYRNITRKLYERRMRHQRRDRGFSDADWWSIDTWLSTVLADAIDTLAKNTYGTPIAAYYLMNGKDPSRCKGVNEISDKEWDRMHKWWKKHLSKIAFCLRESNEDTCSIKNELPFIYHDRDNFIRDSEYPYFYTHDDNLTADEKKQNDAYLKREIELEKYRNKQFKKAMTMLSELHGMLWD